jgi:threonine synthase
MEATTESRWGRRLGRTPLVRAHGLERALGLERVWLKLEGNNPSGHREDRMAYVIIRDARAAGKDTLTIGTSGTVGASLAHLAPEFGVRCVLFVPSRRQMLRAEQIAREGVDVVELGRSYEACVEASRAAAAENGWYDANPGMSGGMMHLQAYARIGDEVWEQADVPPTDLVSQVSNGASVAGLHMELRAAWVAERIERLPRLVAASTSQGNAIVASFAAGDRRIRTLGRADLRESRHNLNVLNARCYNGQDALNALYDTAGFAVGVPDEVLLESHRRFRSLERFRVGVSNAFPIAALFAETERFRGRRVVLVLNDGRVDVDVRRITRDDLPMSYEQFLALLDDWLDVYTDPPEEIRDAADDAFGNGFVVGAFQGTELVGAVVVASGRYRRFFPRYHLAYIATRKSIKGMGIATQLFQKVIELTGGEFSLHVEVENRRAIRLYEKMGLRRKYFRMFYKAPPPGNGE